MRKIRLFVGVFELIGLIGVALVLRTGQGSTTFR
jgi:hypothetical protein